MRILGVDPGLAILGWSIVDAAPSSNQLIQYGTIQTEAGLPMTTRLTQVFVRLKNLFKEFKPAVVAIETLFIVKSAKTLSQVSHTRGVILLAAGQAGVDVFEYAPKQIKLALTGYGGAEKMQVQQVLKRILNLKEIPRPDDAADAVAVALCHAQFAPSHPKAMATV